MYYSEPPPRPPLSSTLDCDGQVVDQRRPARGTRQGERGVSELVSRLVPTKTYFYLNCTACGRPLRALVELLGASVACQHCGNEFTAEAPAVDSSRQ